MNKKKLVSIFLFVITLFLLIATFYLNSLLQNNQKDSVTQIKKTKASAQTYHRYLALNITLPTISGGFSQSNSSSLQPTTVLPSGGLSPTIKLDLNPTLHTTQTILQPTQKNNSSSSSRNPTSSSSSSSVRFTVIPTAVQPTKSSQSSATSRFSSSSKGLLSYNNPTVKITGQTDRNSISNSNSSSVKSIISPSISKKLPETGMVQYSSIIFIVAVTTIFFAFLY